MTKPKPLKLPKNFGKMSFESKPKREVNVHVITSGRYEGYEVGWTNGTQVFPRAGYYLMKSTKSGKVKDIVYLDKVLPTKKLKKINKKI